MGICAVAGLTYLFTEEPFRYPAQAVSSSGGEIIDLRGVPRAHLVIQDGHKQLKYEEGSFWALPPIDLGEVQSDRLDDFLYE